MAKGTEIQRWPFPNSGLMLEYSPSHTPPTALLEAKNMYYPQKNFLRSRSGFTTFCENVNAGEVTLMFFWSSEKKLVWADDLGNLFVENDIISGVDNQVTDITEFTDSSGNNILYVAEEKGSKDHTLHTWDGSSYSQLTGTDVPTAEKVTVRFSQLWATKDPTDPHRIFWSDYNDATTWTSDSGGSGHVDISKGYHGEIVDWLPYRENFFVVKENGVYDLLGQKPSNFRRVLIGGMRGIQPNTITDAVAGVLVVTDHGIFPVARRFAGEPQDLTNMVSSDIESHLVGCQADYSEHLGCFLLCNGSGSVWVSSTNVRPDVWTRFEFDNEQISCVFEGDNLYFGTTDGKILEYNTSSWDDNGTHYDVILKTNLWNLGTNRVIKKIDYIEGSWCAGPGNDANITVYKDEADNEVKPGGWHFGEDDVQILNTNIEALNLSVQVEYLNKSDIAYFGGIAVHTKGVRPYK